MRRKVSIWSYQKCRYRLPGPPMSRSNVNRYHRHQSNQVVYLRYGACYQVGRIGGGSHSFSHENEVDQNDGVGTNDKCASVKYVLGFQSKNPFALPLPCLALCLLVMLVHPLAANKSKSCLCCYQIISLDKNATDTP